MTTKVQPGRLVKLARERQVRDLATASERGLHFDPKAADRVVRFFPRHLRHTKGKWAGEPFELAPWQIDDVIRPLFGWKRADGTRRFRTAYLELARKDGKSTLAGGIGNYLLVADREPGAEIYSSATKRDQARIVWDAAADMVRASPTLGNFVRVFGATKLPGARCSMNVARTGSLFQPLSAESQTLDGLNPHGNIIDELHAHRDREVWDVLDTAMGARRQPLTVAITTAGVYRPESIGWEIHQHGLQVLEGSLEDDAFFAYICAAEKDDDWTDPRVWAKANPNLGISIDEEYLAAQCEKAKQSTAYLNSFLRRHLNIWTSQVTRWLNMDRWNACDAEAFPGDLDGLDCYGGLDLASTIDIAAFVAIFPDAAGYIDILARFWVPEGIVAERVRRDRVPYDAWIRDGLLVATPGDVIDYAWIRKEINEFAERYNLREVGYDRWNADQLVMQLQDDGVTMVPTGLGYASMNAPTKALDGLVRSTRLAHGGNPILRWMASNVATEEDPAGNIKPSKKRSTEKIDGIVALILAVDRLQRHEPEKVYPSGGLMVVES